MTRQEKAVLDAAVRWWRGHKPCDWTRGQHEANPAINARYTDRAEKLALVVGALVQSRKRRRK